MHVRSKNLIIATYDVLSGNYVLLLSGNDVLLLFGNDVLFRLVLVFSDWSIYFIIICYGFVSCFF